MPTKDYSKAIKSRSGKNPPPDADRTPFLRECSGIIALAAAIFIAAALISYSPEDPALSHYSLTGSTNWMGPAGAHLAAFLVGTLGFGCWWIPLLLLLLSLSLFLPDRVILPGYPWVASGFSLVILATSTLLSLLSGLWTGSTSPGGLAGATLDRVLTYWFGLPGALLITLVLFLTGLMAATPLTLAGIFRSAKQIRQKRASLKARASKEPTGKTASPDQESAPRIIAHRKEDTARKNHDGKDKDAFEIKPVSGDFTLPPLTFLQDAPSETQETDREIYLTNARVLEQKLLDFGVAGKVVEICPGPVVTMYEFAPAPGVKINKVASLSDDLALALKTRSVRIVAPIPGKGVIGIELANANREIVYLKDILSSTAFKSHKGKLPLTLGHDIVGNPVVTDLARMPHLLIAGATGTGKSVGLNAMICSLLYRHRPEDLRLLMIDPKRIELSLYDGIPHLLHPVVSEPKEATRALRWAVMEMERRYQLLEEAHVRNLNGYNKTAEQPLPFLVVIIDELADLMMVSSKEVESAIARLAQMARAAGIHLLVATQRPSVDVLTGLIKANFPARISFKVSSKVDSRTILDVGGAERLLGMGDMLFLPPGSAVLERIHGAYVTESEICQIVEFLKTQGEPEYYESVTEILPGEEAGDGGTASGSEKIDDKYDEAVELVTQAGQASISMVQRRLRIGYNRAARMIEQMEKEGIVSPMDTKGRRKVLARGYNDI